MKKDIYIVMNNSEPPNCIEGVFETWISAYTFFLLSCLKERGENTDRFEIFELSKIWIVKKEVDI